MIYRADMIARANMIYHARKKEHRKEKEILLPYEKAIMKIFIL